MQILSDISFERPPVKKKKKSKSLVKDQKRLAYKLMTLNFDLIAKQIELGKSLDAELLLHRDADDEFFGTRAAIEILSGAEPDTVLFDHLDELLASRFLDCLSITPANKAKVAFRDLAANLCDYVEEVGVRVKRPWERNGMRDFLEVTFGYFPDGGCDFFRRNYQGGHFKEVMA